MSTAAVPHLKASPAGHIVNITSLGGQRPVGSSIPYSVSKAAVDHLTRLLASTLGPEVRVNAIAPGAILWPEGGKDEASKAAMLARTPLGRIGTPEEVAGAVHWLLREATYVTGQTLHLDGGRMLDG